MVFSLSIPTKTALFIYTKAIINLRKSLFMRFTRFDTNFSTYETGVSRFQICERAETVSSRCRISILVVFCKLTVAGESLEVNPREKSQFLGNSQREI